MVEPGGVKSEWSEIAFGKMKEASKNSVYANLAQKVEKMVIDGAKHSPEPIVISELIKRAIEASKPKARYVKGYLAKPILFMKTWLSDAMFDRIIMSQIK